MSETNPTTFTDRYHAAYNKFVFVATVSIFISMFDLKDTSNFFGFEIDDLNEQVVELSALLTVVFFGLNLFLRYMDERKIISSLESEMIKFSQSVISYGNKIDQVVEKVDGKLLYSKGKIEEHIKFLQGAYETIVERDKTLLEKLTAEKSLANKMANENELPGNMDMEIPKMLATKEQRLSDEININKNLNLNIADMPNLIVGLQTEMKRILSTSKLATTAALEFKKFPFWVRWRIRIIDRAAPVFLGILSIFTYFCPETLMSVLKCLSSVARPSLQL